MRFRRGSANCAAGSPPGNFVHGGSHLPAARGSVTIASPYALLHDLLVLAPLFALLARERADDRALLAAAVAAYLGALLLPPLGQQLGLALPAAIPLTLWLVELRRQLRHESGQRRQTGHQQGAAQEARSQKCQGRGNHRPRLLLGVTFIIG